MTQIHFDIKNCFLKNVFVFEKSQNHQKRFFKFFISHDDHFKYVVEKRRKYKIATNFCLFEQIRDIFIFIYIEKSFNETIQKNWKFFFDKFSTNAKIFLSLNC